MHIDLGNVVLTLSAILGVIKTLEIVLPLLQKAIEAIIGALSGNSNSNKEQ